MKVDPLISMFGANYPGKHAAKAAHQPKGAVDYVVQVFKSAVSNIGPLGLAAGGPKGAAAATAAGAASGDMDGLFALQAQLQRQAQEFTLRTNIAQAEHDSRMTVIRGIRV